MNAQQAIRATGVFGYWYRRMAINALARQHTPESILILADALNNGHPNAKLIANTLKRLSSTKDWDLIQTIWLAWVENPKPALAAVLSYIGWPTERPLPYDFALNALALLINRPATKETIATVECIARVLPTQDARVTDNLYTAWVYSQSPVLERVIQEQAYKPDSPALEVLFALATAQINRYTALQDTDAQLLTEAIKLAPPALLERISNTITTATEKKQLQLSYRIALSQATIDIDLHLTQLKLVQDEAGLFEQISKLRLKQVVELCERWCNTGENWATGSNRQAVLEQLLAAYNKLKTSSQQNKLNTPKGVIDILDYWQTERREHGIFKPDDPINIARALYLKRSAKCNIASNNWLERLVACIRDNSKLQDQNDDQVCWVTVCADAIKLLQTPIVGTPVAYLQHKRLLAQADQATPTHMIGLLEILCVLQNMFIGTNIVIETLREPAERTAIRVEDYKD